MRILRYNNVCSSDYARCQSQSCHAHGRRRRAQHHHTDTTADPTRCAAHRLLTAVTASVTGGLVAKLRGRYNRTPLHATISHTMTLTTAARRICWRFWQHTGPVMTPPLYTALLSASESPQACQAPAVLVSIGPTAGFNKKISLKTTAFASSEGYRLCRGFGVYRNFFIPATFSLSRAGRARARPGAICFGELVYTLRVARAARRCIQGGPLAHVPRVLPPLPRAAGCPAH